ncbi:hypothetical protein GCM10023161_18110 [Mycobacterium paraffinicum]|uniref:Uncharacterized protein n=1 Tax=Mycobacterium paraffinicum TaxID=53378 RepID=A0ABP8RHP3_9MYCO
MPAANVRSDPSYRTVNTGGAGRLIRTNCIGSRKNQDAEFAGASPPATTRVLAPGFPDVGGA